MKRWHAPSWPGGAASGDPLDDLLEGRHEALVLAAGATIKKSDATAAAAYDAHRMGGRSRPSVLGPERGASRVPGHSVCQRDRTSSALHLIAALR
jgi:hypothetical protein